MTMFSFGSAGIMGSTCSSGSTVMSMRHVLPQSLASFSASAISPGLSTLMPFAPKDSASLTKSGSHFSVVAE